MAVLKLPPHHEHHKRPPLLLLPQPLLKMKMMTHLCLSRPIRPADGKAAMVHRLMLSRHERERSAYITQARPYFTKVARDGLAASDES